MIFTTSVRFVQRRGDPIINQGTIAEQIDDLRRLADNVAFLQVTATPYSLYLQPKGYEAALTAGNYVFKPKRPAFTELLPIHGGYVGGDDYFGDFERSDPRLYLMVVVSDQEQDALRRLINVGLVRTECLIAQTQSGCVGPLSRSCWRFACGAGNRNKLARKNASTR